LPAQALDKRRLNRRRTDTGMTNPFVHNCPLKGRFNMGISWRNGARPKENSPTSGLFCFLVARGGIDQDRRCL